MFPRWPNYSDFCVPEGIAGEEASCEVKTVALIQVKYRNLSRYLKNFSHGVARKYLRIFRHLEIFGESRFGETGGAQEAVIP